MECILEPVAGIDPSTDGAFTRNVNEHVPCGVAFLTKFAHGEYSQDFKIHRGDDAIEVFCRTLISEVERAIRYRKKEMIPLTDEQKATFRTATECYLCNKRFSSSDRKVRDHCHYTGQYRGAAHNRCNLNHRIPSHIPVVFHNLSKYDAHLFIRELASSYYTNERYGVDEMEVKMKWSR